MASPNVVCLMCLDAPAVKKLGTCDHSYCQSCLLAHIKDQIDGQHEVNPCPACQRSKAQNPTGGANVNIARDSKEAMPTKAQKTTAREKKTTPLGNANCKPCHYKSQTVSKDETNVASAAEESGGQEKLLVRDAIQQATARDALRHANCKLCHFKGKTVKAINICKECRQLPLCADCSLGHRQNKATQKHVITPFALPRDEDPCTIHDEPLVLFCTKCSKNVCHVCVCLEHIGHTFETFNNVVFTEVEKVRSALKEEEKWLNMLKSDERKLQQSKATAQDMEDVLIKSIEDHAEKCIEEIIKSKEALKKQVRSAFEVVRVMEKRLMAMPELQRVSRDVAAAANQLLNEQAELHSTYVEKLVGLKQQLDKLTEDHPAYEKDRKKYQKDFKEDVCKKAMKFYPKTPNYKIGGFQNTGLRCDAGGPCMCETCKKTLKWPNEPRVVECRQKGTCTCGTCGCAYNRKMLYYNGYCVCGKYKIAAGNQEFP